jgi:hypothetical protein
MAGVDVEVIIDGPQDKVFDLVTTAGLWPQWAVLARAMAGVTERPFQLGDPIHEFVRTPTGAQEIEWHITEHDRLHHAKSQAEDGLIGVVVVPLRCRQEVAMLHRQLRSVPVHASPRRALLAMSSDMGIAACVRARHGPAGHQDLSTFSIRLRLPPSRLRVTPRGVTHHQRLDPCGSWRRGRRRSSRLRESAQTQIPRIFTTQLVPGPGLGRAADGPGDLVAGAGLAD